MAGNQEKIFKALGDETRLMIVSYLLNHDHFACDFTQCIKKDQTTISRHLSILVDADILKSKKEGRNISYSIKDKKTKDMLLRFGLEKSGACCGSIC